MHKVKEVVLKDVDGKEHRYVIETHTATEGMPIAQVLLRAGAPAALGAMMVAFGGGVAGALGKEMPDMDIGASVTAGLASTDGPALARALLSRTSRANDAGVMVRLDQAGIDDAYGGNYPELYEALLEVVLHNRFLPALERFTKLMPKPTTPTPSLPTPS